MGWLGDCIDRPMQAPPLLDPDFHPACRGGRQILLINPFYPKDRHASYGKHVLTPSLALTSIAAATPSGWNLRIWDENLLLGSMPLDPFPAVVGITVHLTFARRAYQLADWFRRRGSVVILGGLHATSCPEEVLAHADAVAIGEGVQLWPRILKDVAAGRLERVYSGSYAEPAYDSLPDPARQLLPARCFLTTTSLIATRGCHSRCSFCYLATEGMHMPYQLKPVERICREIVANRNPYCVFIDNNLGSRPQYLRQLCRGLAPLGVIWSAAVSIDVTDDPGLVREMALAGCTGVFVGFESLSQRNISDSGKKSPTTDDFARRVALFHDWGIQVNGSFVLGFDHDRREVFEQTVNWIEEHRLECATFHILTPYPGTPLFEQMETQDRLLHRDWERYDTAHAVFRPRHMSPEELEEGYAWCYRRLFSYSSIWRRRPHQPSAVAPYLAMSQLYKKSNWLWSLLIRTRQTAAVWRPLVEVTRRRHLRFRRKALEREPAPGPRDHRPPIRELPAGTE